MLSAAYRMKLERRRKGGSSAKLLEEERKYR